MAICYRSKLSDQHCFMWLRYEVDVAGKRNQAQQDLRVRVMRLLQDDPGMSQRDLAKAVGVSTGGIHYVLRAFLELGLVKLGNFSAAEDKRRYSYTLTPQGLATKTALTRQFLIRKMAEYEALKAEIDTVGSELSEHDEAALRTGVKNP